MAASVPDRPTAPPPLDRGRCASWSPRPGSASPTSSPRCSCARASTSPQPIVSLPGVVQHTRASLRGRRSTSSPPSACARSILFGVPATKDADRLRCVRPDGIVQLALADLRDDGRRRRRADGRPVRRRVHRPRPLRRPRRPRRTSTTTPPSRCYAEGRARPGDGRRPRGRPERDDGRAGRRDPRRARRRRVHGHADPGLLGQVRERRCTGRSATRSTCRSPAAATARATSRTRRNAREALRRDRGRRRPGRRHGDGQAGAQPTST